MLRRLVNSLSRQAGKQGPTSIDELDPTALPILRASELVLLLGLHNRLRTIRMLTKVSGEHFDGLYQTAIDQFIEMAQLVPASAAHHHAGLGGLVIHTLEVVEHALRARNQYVLPQYADPELVAREEHAWTYAVFAAALLHDAGKMLTNTRLRLKTANGSQLWTPQRGAIDFGADSYCIEFLKPAYQAHTRVTASLFWLLPPIGRDFLARHDHIMQPLFAWLNAEHYEWGVIGDLARAADQESTASNLRLGGEKARLPGAPSVPMVERLMSALRQLILNGEFAVNRNGGAIWVDGEYSYVMSQTAALKAAEYLRSEGASDIPSDNTRIFDILQEHGFAQTAPNGRAVWRMKIVAEGEYAHEFTLLKFFTNQLFHPSRRSGVFAGTITPVTDDTGNDEEPAAQTIVAPTSIENTPDTGQCPAPSSSTTTTSEPAADKVAVPTAQTDSTTPAPTVDPDKTEMPAKGAFDLSSDQIHAYFLDWLRCSLAQGSVRYNQASALVHRVEAGALLVSPRIFRKFIDTYDLGDAQNMKVVLRVQNRLANKKFKICIRDGDRNVHTYGIHRRNSGGNNTRPDSTIKGFMIEPGLIFGAGSVPINPVLYKVSTQTEAGSVLSRSV